MHRRARSLVALVPFVAAVALATGALAPASASDADAPLSLRSQSEDLGPGITLQRDTTLEKSGWYDDQVVSIDLSRPAVSTDLLTAGPGVSDRGPLSTAANARGAVAATNADYFDIDGSGAPLGAAVQGSTLLKSAQIGERTQVGVSNDRLASVVDAVLDASVDLGGTSHRILSLNTPNGTAPADALIAFTAAWGTANRTNGLPGATDVVEATVQGGRVIAVTPGAGSGAIPADGFVLQATGASARMLSALAPGTPAELHYRLKDDLEKRMRFVAGGSQILVKDGKLQAQTDTSVAPRTVLGIKDGGRTLLLFTTDGRQNLVPGRTLASAGQRMLALGATDAVNLDGGGSTTLVARAAGDATAAVRNAPSDGAERADPNGIGVFVAPTGRGAASLVVRPDADPAAVRAGTLEADAAFPGLRRTLTLAAVDANLTPVAVPGTPIWWAEANRVQGTASGAVVVPSQFSAGRTVTVSAFAGRVRGSTDLRVLRPLQSLTTSASRLALTGTDQVTHLDVIGHDRYGYTAPVEFEDLALDYDHSVISIARDRSGLVVTPLNQGATLVKLTAAGVTTTLPVTVGVTTSTVYTFDHADEPSRWTPNGTVPTEQTLSLQDGHLKLDFTARRNQGITYAGDAAALTLPGSPLRVRVNFTSSRPMQFSSLRWVDGNGVAGGFLGPAIVAGPNSIDWAFPASTVFPITLSYFQAVETDALKQGAGSIVFDSIQVDQAPALEVPEPGPPTPDALVSADGSAPSSRSTWNFATLSDVQFTAADPELAKVGVAALKRIGALHPDLVVLNGDVTDLGAASDIALARKTLEEGGCDLVRVGQEPPADSTPDPSSGRFPCYYVPGNHESYRANGQGDLAPFVAEFGQPYRTFDHKGTRFILLNSALGTLRGSSWDQLPMLRSALQTATKDASVRNVMVFAHHPVDDPAEAKTSQLGDRMEVALVEKLLSDFRTSTGKGAAMVGSHAQIMNVHRIEGVPYTVLPSSGKAPYGTPDRGGFTGFLNWTVDPRANAVGQWLTADVRAFAQSVTLSAPSTLRPGATATVTGSIVQPSGVKTGDRVVPLRYPMSVHWSGSRELAIGSGALARLRAIAQGKTAILDPATGVLTGLRPGRVTVTVTNESMRAYTGPASLAPVSGSTSVTVTR